MPFLTRIRSIRGNGALLLSGISSLGVATMLFVGWPGGGGHGALNWQVWQADFLLLLSLQFDGEKPDKMTRGVCACNDVKVIFENPLIYSAAVFRVPGMT